MYRIDHCGNLMHFTKGGTANPLDYEEAYNTFKKIINTLTIKGSTKYIFGKKKCVCFTEAPAVCLTRDGKLDTAYFNRYTPFGFQFNKRYIFNLGGRPVIYSTKEEYESEKNNDRINWRYVSYDPNLGGKRDFTWEREWRIHRDSIPFNNEDVKLVFPNREWIDRFVQDHEKEQHGDCEECYCQRDLTIYKFTDFIENCEVLGGTCPDPQKFPWIMIDMDEK